LVGLAALFVAVLVVVQFFLLLLWVYYAIDRLPLFESARRSISLVRGNLKIFVKYYLFIIAVYAVIFFTMLNPCLCCLFLIIFLPLSIFLRLLFAVTLMGLKLKIEKQGSASPATPSKKK
ncbi:MAG: hypothetical protein NT051_00525, partial [Candidatus Micrarchaeota archaeon]|nr:hypothetical protein [Candidatus Micrarchaeota archaeon]